MIGSAGESVRSLAELERVALESPAEAVARAQMELEAGSALSSPAFRLVLARACFQVGDYSAVLEHAEAARRAFEASGEPERAVDALNLVGAVLLERGDWSAATEIFTKCSDALQGSSALSARVRNNLGLAAWRMQDLPRALRAFEDALAAFRALGDARAMGNVLSNIGLVRSGCGEREAARVAYEEALTHVRAAGDRVFEANVLANLADLAEADDDIEGALRFGHQALALRQATGHRRGLAGSWLSFARVRIARREFDEAAAGLDAAEELVHSLALRKHEADVHRIRADLLEAVGNHAGALAAHRKFAALAFGLRNAEMDARIAQLQAASDLAAARRAAQAAAEHARVMDEARRRAEEGSLAKSRFLAVMSHEIRSPLTAVLAAVDLLELSTLGDQQLELAATIRAAGAHLLGMLDDVIDFARLESGKVKLAHEPFDVRRVVEGATDVERARAEAKGLHLEVRIADPGPRIGDPRRLGQVIQNLVGNAVKFTERGSVVLEVRPEPDGTLVLVVADTGIGMSPEQVPELFEPFRQGDASSTRRFGGTGLGLAICREIVHAMGGSIAVETAEGVGSTFSVRLSLPRAPAPAEPPAARAVVGEGWTALVVDDEPLIRKLVGALLRRLGCTVHEVDGGAAALATEIPADVVFLDVHMPEVDGFEVARRIRARAGPRPWLIGLTGAAEEEDRTRGLEAGMDRYLIKPIGLAQLSLALGELRAGPHPDDDPNRERR